MQIGLKKRGNSGRHERKKSTKDIGVKELHRQKSGKKTDSKKMQGKFGPKQKEHQAAVRKRQVSLLFHLRRKTNIHPIRERLLNGRKINRC